MRVKQNPRLRVIVNATAQIRDAAKSLRDQRMSNDVVGAMTSKSQAERKVDEIARKCRRLPTENSFCREFQEAVGEMRKEASEFSKCKCQERGK